MNNGVYALPGFMPPAAAKWKSQLRTNEDGSIKLCVYVGKPGTKVYYSLGIPGWKWGFIKDAQYFIDKRYPQEVIDEVSKFADYLDEEIIELPEGTVIPDIIINGWPVPITESPIEDKVYWILNIPKFVLPVGDTEVQISANGKLIKYTITRPDFSIHYNTLGDTASCEPDGDYVKFDYRGAIAGGRLDTLEDGQYLQYAKTTLTNWRIDLPLLTDGSYMFYGCSSLTTFNSNLSALTSGFYMFSGCSSLTTFNFDLSSLTLGTNMFYGCSSLTTFNSNLSALTSGYYMFYGCSSLTTFEVDLPSITNGSYMFYDCSSLTTFEVDLPSLTDGSYMFYGCSSLTTFNSDLSSLTRGINMFSNCSSLTTFNSDLSSITSGANMFSNCSSLTTFDVDLPSIKNGSYMFGGCSSLTTFDVDLPSLTNGSRMFTHCQLNKESALRVLNSIPSHTSGSHSLTIGIHVDHKNDEEVAAAITAATSKRWSITVQWNGTAGTSGASTYGLRRWNPVYAKLGEPLDDGTPVLDWGHYVTDWEQNGYQEFDNLDEAKNYFGVTE